MSTTKKATEIVEGDVVLVPVQGTPRPFPVIFVGSYPNGKVKVVVKFGGAEGFATLPYWPNQDVPVKA